MGIDAGHRPHLLIVTAATELDEPDGRRDDVDIGVAEFLNSPDSTVVRDAGSGDPVDDEDQDDHGEACDASHARWLSHRNFLLFPWM
jgi:hypothetical protein